MIPAYLHDLHLDHVFSSYTNHVDGYLLASTGNEHIVDSETVKISGFVTATFGQAEDVALKYFEVKNPSRKPYCLFQIDNGAISSATSVKRCDCAILTCRLLSLRQMPQVATARLSKRTTNMR